MKSDHQFKIERVLARHCDALIARGPAPRDPKTIMQEFAHGSAQFFGPALSPLLGGQPCKLIAKDLSEGSLSAWRESLPQPAKAFGMSGPAGKPEILIGVDLASAMMLTDIAFGGTGEPAKSLPEKWPSAAISVIETLGRAAAAALGKALEYPAALTCVSDWQDCSKTAFLCGANELYWTQITPSTPNDGAWSIALAMPARHAKIVEGGGAAPTPENARSPSGPASAPFGSIPLNARCELTQLRLPISRVATLKTGDIFPLSIPREVPISVAGREIARGAIGALDECVAIEITRLGQA